MLEFHLDHIQPPQTRVLTPSGLCLTLPFHAVEYGEFHEGDTYFTRRDGLKNYLLLVTVEGCGRMSQNGQTVTLEPGSALVIDCEPEQSYCTLPGHVWHFHYLHFGALSMEGYRSILLRRLTPVSLRVPSKVHSKMGKLRQYAERSDATASILRNHLISGLLTETVASLADSAETVSGLNRTDIAALCEFIRKHFYEDLHIDDFMRETHLSRHYLIHVFERQMGMSPHRYLHLCRINHAQVLLKTTDMTIEEIAYGIGYHSAAVFIRHFKAFHAITPNEYRRVSVRSV